MCTFPGHPSPSCTQSQSESDSAGTGRPSDHGESAIGRSGPCRPGVDSASRCRGNLNLNLSRRHAGGPLHARRGTDSELELLGRIIRLTESLAFRVGPPSHWPCFKYRDSGPGAGASIFAGAGTVPVTVVRGRGRGHSEARTFNRDLTAPSPLSRSDHAPRHNVPVRDRAAPGRRRPA